MRPLNHETAIYEFLAEEDRVVTFARLSREFPKLHYVLLCDVLDRGIAQKRIAKLDLSAGKCDPCSPTLARYGFSILCPLDKLAAI
jgi:hypothetical protein